MKKLILFLLIILLLSGCSRQNDLCAEKLFDEAINYAELAGNMSVADAVGIAESNRDKIIRRLDFAIKLYC